MDIYVYNSLLIFFLLLITILSSFLPLWIVSSNQIAENSSLRQLFMQKFPYLTAGVFMGAGMLHLLPNALEQFDLATGDQVKSKFPWVFFCSCIGCGVVWSIDLLNMGNSEKMVAIAMAAAPSGGACMCRIKIPSMATYASPRHHSEKEETKQLLPQNVGKASHHYGKLCTSCEDEDTGTPAHTLISRISQNGATKMFIFDGKQNVSRKRAFSLDEVLVDEEDTEAVNQEAIRSVHSEKGLLSKYPSAAGLPHSHIDDAVSEHVVFSGENSVLPFLLAALFSVHSLIAGFTLGVHPVVDETTIATTIAILSHKFIEAASVGSNFAKEQVELNKSAMVLLIYAFMTPLGIILGMILTTYLEGSTSKMLQSIVMGIGSGSFVYLAFHEMSEDDSSENTWLEKVSLFSCGLLLMAGLATIV